MQLFQNFGGAHAAGHEFLQRFVQFRFFGILGAGGLLRSLLLFQLGGCLLGRLQRGIFGLEVLLQGGDILLKGGDLRRKGLFFSLLFGDQRLKVRSGGRFFALFLLPLGLGMMHRSFIKQSVGFSIIQPNAVCKKNLLNLRFYARHFDGLVLHNGRKPAILKKQKVWIKTNYQERGIS